MHQQRSTIEIEQASGGLLNVVTNKALERISDCCSVLQKLAADDRLSGEDREACALGVDVMQSAVCSSVISSFRLAVKVQDWHNEMEQTFGS